MSIVDFAAGLLGAASSTDQVPGTGGRRGIGGAASHNFKAGTRDGRPTAVDAGVGFLYYSTDQVALDVSDGINWHRVGPSNVGDIIWTAETTARTGYVLLDGSALANSGIYADLYAIWGGTLPDVRGRTFAAIGPHTDMATILSNEGVATAANRRQKHRTTNALTAAIGTLAATLGSLTATRTTDVALSDPGHGHTLDIHDTGNGYQVTGGGGGLDDHFGPLDSGRIAADSNTTGITVSQQPTFSVGGAPGLSGSPTLGGSVGTNVANDPLDAGAYVVLQPQAKL